MASFLDSELNNLQINLYNYFKLYLRNMKDAA